MLRMIGITFGIIIMFLGLGGLGFALSQMMTQTGSDAALMTVAGLAVFVVACFAGMIAAR